MDIDEAARQLREDLKLYPLRLDDVTRQPESHRLSFLPVSVGISLGLSAVGIPGYCLHKKECLRLRFICKKASSASPPEDVEAPALEATSRNEQTRALHDAVATILHEYAEEVRCMGSLPFRLAHPREPDPSQTPSKTLDT